MATDLTTYNDSGDNIFTPAPANTPTTSVGANYGGEIATGLGGLSSAYATYIAGKAQRKLAGFNAKLAKQQAAQAIQAGEFAANRVEQHARQVEAAGQAAAAASGVVVGAGSQRFVQASNEAASNMDRMMIDLNARREAYGFQVRAQAATIQGRMAESSDNVGAAQTLLSTGSRMWRQADPNNQIILA